MVAPGFDGLDDGAVGCVGAGYAVAPERGGGGVVGGVIDDGDGVDQGLILESGLDVERAVLDEDVGVIASLFTCQLFSRR
jgi:hypothetical protein